MYCHIILEVRGDFKCTGPQIDWCTGNWYFWLKYDLGQKYYAPDLGSNSWPPDHDSTLHVTDTAALTTRPSVTSICVVTRCIDLVCKRIRWSDDGPSLDQSCNRTMQLAGFQDELWIMNQTFPSNYALDYWSIRDLYFPPLFITFLINKHSLCFFINKHAL